MGVFNFVSDGLAPTDGVSDASGAVDAWLAYAAANDGSTLIIPAHSYHLASTNAFGNGVRNCIIQAEQGAVVDALFIGKPNLIAQDFLHHARIQTVLAGATSATLVTGSQISRFAVNQWVLFGGPSVQTPDSFPQNFEFNEYRQIASIVGSTIFWAEPLFFTYRSTWPLADPAVVKSYDYGGPATIYAMPTVFDGEQVYSGLACSETGVGTSCAGGRSLIIDSMSFAGNGPSISNVKHGLINNSQIGDQNEVDKANEFIEYRDCYSTKTKKQVLVQSAAGAKQLRLKRTVLTTLNGTAYNTIIDGGSIDVFIGGATSFGRSNSILLLNNPTIGAYDPSTGSRTATHIIALTDLTFSAGVFRVANAGNLYDTLRLFVPGFKYAVGWNDGSGGISIVDNSSRVWSFTVTDMTQDGTYTYVTTNLSALPGGGVTFSGHAANSIFAYACRSVTPSSHALAAINAFVEPGNKVMECNLS